MRPKKTYEEVVKNSNGMEEKKGKSVLETEKPQIVKAAIFCKISCAVNS